MVCIKLTFDLVAIAWLFYNALDQPYRERYEIVQRLRRDGLVSHAVRLLRGSGAFVGELTPCTGHDQYVHPVG